MRRLFNSVAVAMLFGILAPQFAFAGDPDGSGKGITTLGKPSEKYDRKLEAAAIERAANNIGELRGSLHGFEGEFIVETDDLENGASKSLGFPTIRETLPARSIQAGAVPLV